MLKEKINNFLDKLSNKMKLLALFIAGAASALAMPPIGAFFILPFSLYVFIHFIYGANNLKKSFIYGWVFGAGYFIFGLYWISYALFVDIEVWWWVLPLSLIIAPTIFALYYGFVPLLSNRYKSNKTLYVISTCTSLALIEWIRGHAFTGFPWNLFGYTWYTLFPITQVSAYVGIYGLTLLTLIWSSTFLIDNKKVKYAIAASFIISLVLGVYRLHNAPIDNYNMSVRIVQPNIPEEEKWDPYKKYDNMKKLLNLTGAENTTEAPIKFVIWPETAALYRLNNSSTMVKITTDALPKGSIGIFGSMNTDEEAKQFYNSISVVKKNKGIINTYNKHHLVPFGEYIPFRKYLDLTPIANGIAMIGDFTKGDGAHTIKIDDTLPSFSPLICYEAIFPSEVTTKQPRPDFLVNATNDAWYGISAGPYQHFENVRMRSIEEGLPLIRAANTGISAMFDAYGRITAELPLSYEGKIDVLLPKAIAPTLYSKYKDSLFFTMILILTILCEVGLKRKLN